MSIMCSERSAFLGRNKRLYGFEEKNDIPSVYDLLVYIAHTQKERPTKLEDEYSANVWAIERCFEYHIPLKRNMLSGIQLSLNKLYDKETEPYQLCDLFGIKKPNWVKTKEDYSTMKVYDDIFDIDINEVLRSTSRKRKTNTQ